MSGSDPAVAIEENPIPEPEVSFASVQMIGAKPLSTGEIEVKSLPPEYANITDFEAGGPEGTTIDSENNSTDVQSESEQPFILEPSELEVSPFIPGFGLSSQPPLFQQQITSLPPEETTLEDQPITNTQTTSTLDECLTSPELCQEPTQQLPVDICQEQPDLPKCMQAENNLGEDIEIEYSDVAENAVLR